MGLGRFIAMTAISQTLDCRDAVCPGPVIEVSRGIRRIQVNQVLEILATDPGFVPDIRAFAMRTGHALVSLETGEAGTRALVRRTH